MAILVLFQHLFMLQGQVHKHILLKVIITYITLVRFGIDIC